MKRYCVYAHVAPDGEIFYIGCGTTRRPFTGQNRNKTWSETIERIAHYSAQVLASSDDHQTVLQLERELIDLHKPPCNLRSGGGGIAERPSNALYLRDLRPGEVFTFCSKMDPGVYRLIDHCLFVNLETGNQRGRSPTTWVIPQESAA